MNTIAQRQSHVKKKKSPLLRVVRACIQIAFFIFLPALYISAFSDLKIVFESIAGGTFNLSSMLPQVIELLAVIPVYDYFRPLFLRMDVRIRRIWGLNFRSCKKSFPCPL